MSANVNPLPEGEITSDDRLWALRQLHSVPYRADYLATHP